MRKLGLCLFVLWAGDSEALPAFGVTSVVLQPVLATGQHTIIGSDIFLPAGGQRVKIEIRVSGWVENLRIIQVNLNASGFDNGFSPISHSDVTCPSNNSAGHSFCAQTLEAGSKCARGCAPGATVGCFCESGFQNTVRPDYLGFGHNYFFAVDISNDNYRFGMTTDTGDFVPDEGAVSYFGTFYIDVPPGGQGTYVLKTAPNLDAHTYMRATSSQDIPIELLTPARIIIGTPQPPGIRYVAYQGRNPGEQTALRVELTSLYLPGPPVAPGEDRDFSALEDQVRWVGPPEQFPDTAPGSTIWAAPLQCTPHFADWGALGRFHIYGDVVMPSSTYTVMEIPIKCQVDPDDPACFGPTEVLHTGQWGDVTVPFARSDQPAQPDMVDVAETVDAFRHLVDAVPKSRAQLRNSDPALDVNYLDVNLAVDAVRSMPYPLPFPADCP